MSCNKTNCNRTKVFTGYLWQDGSINRTFNVDKPGKYYVQVTNSNHCKAADTVIINTLLLPPSNFLGADTSVCVYGKTTIEPLKKYVSYLWSTGETGSSIVINKPGKYWLGVKDNKGCVGNDTINVLSKQCLEGLFVPNAFSPNRDGKNDQLKAIVFGKVEKFILSIYNRFGQVVFKTLDYNVGWDGRFKGRDQDLGLFVWVCKYQFEGLPEKTDRGYVELIR